MFPLRLRFIWTIRPRHASASVLSLAARWATCTTTSAAASKASGAPRLRLGGRWLEQFGFSVGDDLQVTAGQGLLLISRRRKTS
nr:SymE family type I addiction module toxin [Dokdonella sp.]